MSNDDPVSPTSNERLTPEQLAQYREIVPLGIACGVGGGALAALLDEIERLTRELAKERDNASHEMRRWKADANERDRLRAALEKIRDYPGTATFVSDIHTWAAMGELAKVALSGEPNSASSRSVQRRLEAQRASDETSASLSPEDEKRIGESERELAVLKKDGRSYTTRRVAGQALEVITLLKAKTASPLDWMECPVTKEPCNCHGFCKRMAESSEKAPETFERCHFRAFGRFACELPKDHAGDHTCRLPEGPSPQPAAAQATVDEQIFQDMLIYGLGFTMHAPAGRRRVPPDAVTIDLDKLHSSEKAGEKS